MGPEAEDDNAVDNPCDACRLYQVFAGSQEEMRATLFRSILGETYTKVGGESEAEKP